MSRPIDPEDERKCAGCGSVNCKRDRSPSAARACGAIARVRRLSRFGADFLRGTVSAFVDPHGIESAPRISVEAIALLRECRRISREDRPLSERYAAIDVVAAKLIDRLLVDFHAVDLDAAVGDLCPRCKKEKTPDEGARDYWCVECMRVEREAVELG